MDSKDDELTNHKLHLFCSDSDCGNTLQDGSNNIIVYGNYNFRLMPALGSFIVSVTTKSA